MRPTTEGLRENIGHNVHVWGDRERTTYRVSTLGPVEWWWTRDDKLGITIQDPPPESGRQTHLLYFTYLYCILSRAWKLATSLLYEHLFLFSMLILHVTWSWFCLYLLNIYHFTYTFSHAHTEAHTHQHTCTISTQEEWRQPGTGAWFRGVEERLLLETLHTQKKNVRKKPIFTNLKTKIRAHRASSKVTRLFLTK